MSAGASLGSFVTKAFLDGSGCIQVITQDSASGEIFSRGQSSPNGNWTSDWTTLGSPPPACDNFVVSPLGRSVFDRVYATSGNIYAAAALPVYVSQKSKFVVGEQVWSGWVPATWTTPENVPGVFLFLAAGNQDKRIEMFAINDFEYGLWHTWQDDKDQWTGEWDNLGRPPDSPGDSGEVSFAVAIDVLGRLTVARWQSKSDEGIYTIGQTAANNGWGEWTHVTNYPIGVIRLMRQANGVLMIIGLGENGLTNISQLQQ